MRILLVAMILAAPATAPTSRPGGAIVPPARRDVPGKRITLTCGELFIPDFVAKDSKKTDLVLWFHGAAWCAEQVFYDAHKDAVLVTVNAKTWKDGLDAKKFDAMLAEIAKALERPV